MHPVTPVPERPGVGQETMVAELNKRQAEDADLKLAAGAAVSQHQQESLTRLNLLAKRIKHAARCALRTWGMRDERARTGGLQSMSLTRLNLLAKRIKHAARCALVSSGACVMSMHPQVTRRSCLPGVPHAPQPAGQAHPASSQVQLRAAETLAHGVHACICCSLPGGS